MPHITLEDDGNFLTRSSLGVDDVDSIAKLWCESSVSSLLTWPMSSEKSSKGGTSDEKPTKVERDWIRLTG